MFVILIFINVKSALKSLYNNHNNIHFIQGKNTRQISFKYLIGNILYN